MKRLLFFLPIVNAAFFFSWNILGTIGKPPLCSSGVCTLSPNQKVTVTVVWELEYTAAINTVLRLNDAMGVFHPSPANDTFYACPGISGKGIVVSQSECTRQIAPGRFSFNLVTYTVSSGPPNVRDWQGYVSIRAGVEHTLSNNIAVKK